MKLIKLTSVRSYRDASREFKATIDVNIPKSIVYSFVRGISFKLLEVNEKIMSIG